MNEVCQNCYLAKRGCDANDTYSVNGDPLSPAEFVHCRHYICIEGLRAAGEALSRLETFKISVDGQEIDVAKAETVDKPYDLSGRCVGIDGSIYTTYSSHHPRAGAYRKSPINIRSW